MKIRGIEIELHDNEAFSNHIRRENDFFEAEILDYLADYHKNQDTIVDIGANIGNHSIYFANFLTYNAIIAFEPVPENFQLLKRNMEKYDNIGLAEIAVSDVTDYEHMARNTGNMGAGKLDVHGDLLVKTIPLDKMHLQYVTLLKIDVEGHEPAVLEGAKDTLFRCHPLILIEDWYNTYGPLLVDYELEKAWPQHKTYLYRWKN